MQECTKLRHLVSELQQECSNLRTRLTGAGAGAGQTSLRTSATIQTRTAAPLMMLAVFSFLAFSLPGSDMERGALEVEGALGS